MRSPFRPTAFRVTLLGLVWGVLALSPASAVNRYVRETPCLPVDCPTGFTTPWATPYFSLQDALAASTSGDTIHVAVGTYHPDNGIGITPGDRNAVFKLKPGVTLKGGYAGVPTLPDPVDPVTYPGDPVGEIVGHSTLSGDIGFSGNVSDNSLLVVDAPPGIQSTAALDRFIVKNDCLSGSICQALRVRGSSPTVSNSSFKGKGSDGGAIAISNPNAALTWTAVTADGEATNNGGAIYAVSFVYPITLTSVDLKGQATQGGGLYVVANKLTLSGKIHDSDAERAGGIYFSGQEAYLTDVTLAANEALDDLGGGELLASRVIEVANSFVQDNIAYGYFGTAAPTGGLRLSGGRQKVLLSTFERNSAFGYDPTTSALELEGSDLLTGAEVINCLFSGLPFSPSILLYFNGGGPGLVADSTFSGTGCKDAGQGYSGEAGILWTNSSLKVANTVLSEHDLFDFAPNFPTTFVASQIYPSFASVPFDPGTCFPAMGSPLVDAGDNSEVPPYLTTSLNGHRFSSTNQCPAPVDIGAYERADPSTLCRADFDGDCSRPPGVSDIFAHQRAWFARKPEADIDGNGLIEVADIFEFLRLWFAGCP